MNCKKVIPRLEKLHMIRRILHRKATMDFPLYPGQLHLLEFVRAHKGCTQAEVAEHLMITPASVALSTKRMERSGFLEKRFDPKNRRRKKLYITDMGKQLSLRCRKVFDEMDSVMLKGFSKKELSDLNNIIDRFFKNLSEQYSCNTDEIDFFSLYAMNHRIKAKKKEGRKP